MANWSLPTLTSLYTALIGQFKDRDTDCARMFSTEYTVGTNLDTGTIRWNNTNEYWEKYNGSTWPQLPVAHGDKAGGSLHSAVTTSVNGFMIAADKQFIDDITLSAAQINKAVQNDGDIITGALTILYGVTPMMTVQAGASNGYPQYRIVDHNSQLRAQWYYSYYTGEVMLIRKSAAGALETTLTLEDDGNVSVDGSAPTADENLTRKDYVDGKTDGCLVYKYDSQAITASTVTTITWDEEVYDDRSIHSEVTNNSRLTVPAGVTRIKISAQVSWGGISAGQEVSATIYKNGSSSYGGRGRNERFVGSTSEFYMQVETAVIEVVEGDYFELKVWHNDSSGTIYVNWNEPDPNGSYSWFSMALK